MPRPDAALRHPQVLANGTVHPDVVHLTRVIGHPNIAVGDYTYAHDFDPSDDWAARLAPWLCPAAPERPVIGRFCQIAQGARCVTAYRDTGSGGQMKAASSRGRVRFDAPRRDGLWSRP